MSDKPVSAAIVLFGAMGDLALAGGRWHNPRPPQG